MSKRPLGQQLAANLALISLPVCLWQGWNLRRTTPRLAEVGEPRHGIIEGGAPHLHLLGIGESPMAGVGLERAEDIVAARLAGMLSKSSGRETRWRVVARGGVTVRDTVHDLLPAVPEEHLDLVVIALGVNDSLRMRSARGWRSDLKRLVAGLRKRAGNPLILLAGVPPMTHFPALPFPLSGVLGLRARLLDQVSAELAASDDRLIHVPLPLDGRSAELFCRDGFHPNARAHDLWAEQLAGLLGDLNWPGSGSQ